MHVAQGILRKFPKYRIMSKYVTKTTSNNLNRPVFIAISKKIKRIIIKKLILLIFKFERFFWYLCSIFTHDIMMNNKDERRRLMKFREKKKRKKKKWEWILELFDVFDVLIQIIWWLIRAAFHLIAKILN